MIKPWPYYCYLIAHGGRNIFLLLHDNSSLATWTASCYQRYPGHQGPILQTDYRFINENSFCHNFYFNHPHRPHIWKHQGSSVTVICAQLSPDYHFCVQATRIFTWCTLPAHYTLVKWSQTFMYSRKTRSNGEMTYTPVSVWYKSQRFLKAWGIYASNVSSKRGK